MATKKIARKSNKCGVLTPLRLGNAVLIRTVTLYYTGRIEAIDEHEILLSSAAWVADTGRFNEAVAKGTLSAVEPYPGPVLVGRGAVADICDWPGELPREVK